MELNKSMFAGALILASLIGTLNQAAACRLRRDADSRREQRRCDRRRNDRHYRPDRSKLTLGIETGRSKAPPPNPLPGRSASLSTPMPGWRAQRKSATVIA